jgi:hypothetical protein
MLKKRDGIVCVAFRRLRMGIGVYNLVGIRISMKGGEYLEQLSGIFSRCPLLHGVSHFTVGLHVLLQLPLIQLK